LARPGRRYHRFSDRYHYFINRDERRFKFQLAIYSGVIGLHFFDGAIPAGASAELNVIRR
jgi:hypothetical protein